MKILRSAAPSVSVAVVVSIAVGAAVGVSLAASLLVDRAFATMAERAHRGV